jgi:hypothetical protein
VERIVAMYVCKEWAIKTGPCNATFNDLLCSNSSKLSTWLPSRISDTVSEADFTKTRGIWSQYISPFHVDFKAIHDPINRERLVKISQK